MIKGVAFTGVLLGMSIVSAGAFTYSASQSSGYSSHSFSSSYGNLSVSPSTAPISYLMDFTESYVNTPTNDPTITFSGTDAPYDIHISQVNYKFYRGGASFGNLISETVDGVEISVAPIDYNIYGGGPLTPAYVPEPSVAAMLAAWALATCSLRRRGRARGSDDSMA